MADLFPMDNTPNYQAIADTPLPSQASSPFTGLAPNRANCLPLSRRFPFTTRKLLVFLGAAAILISIAFTSARIGRDSVQYRNVASYVVDRLHHASENIQFWRKGRIQHESTGYVPLPGYPAKPVIPIGSALVQRFGDGQVIREGDWSSEELVFTGKCTPELGLWCRARIIVSNEGDEVTIKAGISISAESPTEVLNVDSATQTRVKAIKLSGATKWAKSLLALVTTELGATGAQVSVDQIAQAIMLTKDIAATCARTDDDASCRPLYEVDVIQPPLPAPPSSPECLAVINTAEQEPCREYFLLPPSPTSTTQTGLEIAASSCGGLEFCYHGLGVNVPFCTTTCPQSDCPNSLRTVFAEFFVTSELGRGDCLALAYLPLYTSMYRSQYSTLPACDDALQPGKSDSGDNFIEFFVYSSGDWLPPFGTIPPQIAEDVKACGDKITTAVITIVGASSVAAHSSNMCDAL